MVLTVYVKLVFNLFPAANRVAIHRDSQTAIAAMQLDCTLIVNR